MIYLDICSECKGEGRRSQPPYDPKHPDRPLRWRAKEDCDVCGGSGYVPCLVILPDLSYTINLFA